MFNRNPTSNGGDWVQFTPFLLAYACPLQEAHTTADALYFLEQKQSPPSLAQKAPTLNSTYASVSKQTHHTQHVDI